MENKKNKDPDLNYIMTREQIRSLIFFTRKNNAGKTEFVLMNKWYWLETFKLAQMASYVVKFAKKGTKAKEIAPCIYQTSYSEEEIKKILIEKGASFSDEFKRNCRE